MTGRCLLYAGPTLHRALAISRLDLRGLTIVPPVKRGDITQLLDLKPAGIIIIVDGYFHLANLAVGHLELRTAMKLGWTVWGGGSMGALRACEMRGLGVRGFGSVYEHYCRDPTLRDDEVALLHDPRPPYREHTEPLIHIRHGLADLRTRGVISNEDEHVVVERLMQMWFGERSLATVRTLIEARIGVHHASVLDQWVAEFDRHRLKALDLIEFVAARTWENPP